MTTKQKNTIAKQHPVLYLYVSVSILLEIIYFLYGAANLNKPISHTSQVITICVLSAIYITVYGYLLVSKNLRTIKMILMIFLILQVLSLLSLLLRAINSIDFIISVIDTSFTYYAYRVVSGKKPLII